MTGYFAAAARQGMDLVVTGAGNTAGREVRGYISPIDAADPEKFHKNTRPGRVNGEKYLLIAEPAAIVQGEMGLTVTAAGKVYEVLRAEPVYVGGRLGHWEGVLRLKGGAADA